MVFWDFEVFGGWEVLGGCFGILESWGVLGFSGVWVLLRTKGLRLRGYEIGVKG